jgi:hypothetical protein
MYGDVVMSVSHLPLNLIRETLKSYSREQTDSPRNYLPQNICIVLKRTRSEKDSSRGEAIYVVLQNIGIFTLLPGQIRGNHKNDMPIVKTNHPQSL